MTHKHIYVEDRDGDAVISFRSISKNDICDCKGCVPFQAYHMFFWFGAGVAFGVFSMVV